ncbi:MAG: gamma-glutamylcyclotransferase [Myxococcales bacterium]|nr:gamma-glutamylcyclotransferase [Myxococcales bacterium]
MATRLFIYGTLMRGEVGHHLLGAARYVGAARTHARYTLLRLGWYPALIEGGETAVRGEVYDVDDAALPALDAYEDAPALYTRSPVALQDAAPAAAYLLRPERRGAHPVIAHGDWRRRDEVTGG